MLSVTGGTSRRDCRGTSRREFLRIGSLGIGGLTLADWLAVRAHAAASDLTIEDRAVVLLFLQGGPSHIELFDPKMTAPSEFRSTTGEVRTTLPGITFGGTFPRLARMADRLAVVRSYQSKNSGHTYQNVASGRNPLKATMGALYSRVAGINNPVTGIPNHALVTAEGVKPDLKLRRNFETQALAGLTSAGSLGKAYEAFNPSAGGEFKKSLELRLPRGRFEDRRSLLAGLDRFKKAADDGAFDSTDRYRQQAFDMIMRGAAEAFDLSGEDPRTLERYDTSKLFKMEELNRYNDMYRSSNLLGHQMLMARRLVEAGCGFVTVADAGWDMHGNNNSLPRLSGMVPLGRQVDHAVSAFLEDLAERGLSEKILLVITGEMGRTPRINGRGGRDHYGELTSLVFAGGGLKMGQVIGRSDRNASRPASRPYRPENLLATVMHAVLDVGQIRASTKFPAVLADVVAGGEPISELF